MKARGHATGALGARAANAQIVPGEMPAEGTVFTFSERFACPEHGPSLVELEPRIFSFNSPHGACERCHGLGAQMEIDPELLVPDPTLSVGEGALAPWSRAAASPTTTTRSPRQSPRATASTSTRLGKSFRTSSATSS